MTTKDSYSLQEVAERLGISRRTLQRRIKEGEFPRRRLEQTKSGWETRIDANDVEDALRRESGSYYSADRRRGSQDGSSLSREDLEWLSSTFLQAVHEERQVFLDAIREISETRSYEFKALESHIEKLEQTVESLQDKLQNPMDAPMLLEAPLFNASRLPAVIEEQRQVDPESEILHRELDELEQMLGIGKNKN